MASSYSPQGLGLSEPGSFRPAFAPTRSFAGGSSSRAGASKPSKSNFVQTSTGQLDNVLGMGPTNEYLQFQRRQNQIRQSQQNEQQLLRKQQLSKGINNPSSLTKLQSQLKSGQINENQFISQFGKASAGAKGASPPLKPFRVTPGVVGSSAATAGREMAQGVARTVPEVTGTIAQAVSGKPPIERPTTISNFLFGKEPVQTIQQKMAGAKASHPKGFHIPGTPVTLSPGQTGAAEGILSAAQDVPVVGGLAKSGLKAAERATAAVGKDVAVNDLVKSAKVSQIKSAAAKAPTPKPKAAANLSLPSGPLDIATASKSLKTAGYKPADINSILAQAKSTTTEGRPTVSSIEIKSLASKIQPTKLNEAGSVNVEPLVKTIEQHQQAAKATGAIANDFSTTKGIEQSIGDTIGKSLKATPKQTTADKAALQAYRDAGHAGLPLPELPEHLQAENDKIIEMNKSAIKADAAVARAKGMNDKAKEIESRDPEFYTHRLAKNKGGKLDYNLRGDTHNPLSVGMLGTKTSGSFGRVLHAITGPNGERKIVEIGNETVIGKRGTAVSRAKQVSEVTNKGKTRNNMGRLQKATDQKKVTEFFDPKVRNAMEQTLQNLGVSHERVVEMRGRGMRHAAGVSFVGKKSIKTKAASPEDVIIHELGHQADEAFRLQEKWVNNKVTKDELRALADLRTGDSTNKSFSKYVRSGPEKIAVMFQAYLRNPQLFKDTAPKTFTKFENFLKRHKEFTPIRTTKPGLEMTKDVVKSGPDRIPGTFVDKNGVRWKIGQATQEEITKATGQEYHTDPTLATHLNLADSQVALAHVHFIENTKKVLENKGLAIKEGEGTAPKGFVRTNNPYFPNYRMDPRIAAELDMIAGNKANDLQLLSKTSAVLRQSIVYFPPKHILNMLSGFLVDRADKFLSVPGYYRGAKSFTRALKAVHTHNELYHKYLKSDMSMMGADQKILEKAVKKQVKSNLSDKARLAMNAKALGMSPKTLYNAIQKLSVYDLQDVFNIARTEERQMKTMFHPSGRTFKESLAKTKRYNFQYKIPAQIGPGGLVKGHDLGKAGKSLSNLLRGRAFFFAPYTYDKFRIGANILKDTANIAHPRDATEALAKLAAVTLIGTAVWGEVNKGLQKVTGNKNAHVTAPGVTGVAELVNKEREHKAGGAQIASQFSVAAPFSIGAKFMTNSDQYAVGGKVYDPNATPKVKAEQTGSWLAHQLSPVQKFSSAQKNTAKNKAIGTILSLAGASLPKNTPAANKVNSVIYDSLPLITAEAKAAAKSGNHAEVTDLINRYNNELYKAVKSDPNFSGKIPYYHPKQSTIAKWFKDSTTKKKFTYHT